MTEHPDQPPLDPPADCRHPLMWMLARWLLDAHRPGVDGLCCLCRPAEVDPCLPRRMAAAGLRAACGTVDSPTGAAWLDVVRHRLVAGEIDQSDVAGEAMWAALRRVGNR
jgi:hypothetical protein